MPRPIGLPKFDHLGPRVKWWRIHRKMSRDDLAKKLRIAPSTLADLENNRTKTSRKSHLMAAVLRLNPHYLDTDEGEPEAGAPQELPDEQPWPFDIPQNRVAKLNKIELSYAESKLLQALDEIERARRSHRKSP